ncbi:hypothetical protein BGX31_001298 [Mortierella sp. GBA43]|nr:hypothetical protein BGX31_001298 [Mortierella sp. GBA43]
MSESASQSEESYGCPSKIQEALECPEILRIIGEWILVDEWKTLPFHRQFQPQTLLNCCLVSKYWHEVLTPLLWSIDDTQRMGNVPRTLLEKYSKYVRTLKLWGYIGVHTPPKYTRLRHLSIDGDGMRRTYEDDDDEDCLDLGRGYGTGYDNGYGYGFHGKGSIPGLGNETDNSGKGDRDITTLGTGRPLRDVKTSLEDLTLRKITFTGTEFFATLSDVAEGSLSSLTLYQLMGSFDLQGLIFASLTRLCLSLGTTVEPKLYEIIGRSPRLEHLELRSGHPEDGDWCYGNFSHHLEPLTLLLRGNLPMDPSRARVSAPRQWFRPQLAALQLRGLHTQEWGVQEESNNPDYLELIRACSNTFNKHKMTGYLGSLRELVISLRDLDDDARGAIEMHSSSLEILRITIERIQRGGRHSRVLRKIFQSCRHLREFEYWDLNGDADISVMMATLIGGDKEKGGEHDAQQQQEQKQEWQEQQQQEQEEQRQKPLDDPKEEVEEPEQRFVDDDESGGGGTWVMTAFQWDPTLHNGTAFLLDAHLDAWGYVGQEESDRPKQGEELIRRFLRHIAPSRKLKKLQLAELKFVRAF